jgi:AcrR family transcriptional regulator
MSPAPARTSLSEIVAAGRELLEAGGLEAVTMLAVAERVGVRAPSLYKRVANRAALVSAIGGVALDEIAGQLASLAEDPDAASALRSMAAGFRAYAHDHPRSYELLFMNLPEDWRPPAAQNARASTPILEAARRLVGRDDALEAARLITAFTHGFISMELNGSFRLAGDPDRAFRYGLDALIDALRARGRRGRRRTSSGAGVGRCRVTAGSAATRSGVQGRSDDIRERKSDAGRGLDHGTRGA